MKMPRKPLYDWRGKHSMCLSFSRLTQQVENSQLAPARQYLTHHQSTVPDE